MAESGRIIILGTTKIGETSIVLHTLSQGEGRRSFICNIGKKVSMTLFLPLNVIDCEIVENLKSELRRVRSLSLVYPLNSIRSDIYKASMCMFMSELLYRAIRDGGEDGLFEWAEKSILTLESLQGDFSNYHLRFLMELCSQMGFAPSSEGMAPFAGECYDDIKKLLSSPLPEFLIYPLNGARRNDIAAAVIKYLGYHTESRLELRSLSVLKELFI